MILNQKLQNMEQNQLVNLKKLILESSKLFIEDIVKYNGKDNICAFSLYSDESAMTVCPAANTKDYLKQHEIDKNNYLYYKWNPEEWNPKIEIIERFNPICKIISEIGKSLSLDDFINHRNQLFNLCIEVLIEIRELQLLNNDCIFVFAVSDSFNKNKEIEWIKKINKESDFLEFEKWIAFVDLEDDF